VREIMMLKQQLNDVLFKLYQYTMPFIKHNCLNFPPLQFTLKAVLMHMVQVMELICLGLYSPRHKTPTWQIRRQLFVFFTNLLTRGTMRDIYTFCQYRTYMLWLVLMEYFVYFTSKHMTAEMQLLLKCTGTFYDHQRTQGLVQYITYHFRNSALQTEELDWTLVESKAQLSVDRCNCTCKSLQLLGREKFAVLANTMTPRIFRLAIDTQRLDARIFLAPSARATCCSRRHTGACTTRCASTHCQSFSNTSSSNTLNTCCCCQTIERSSRDRCCMCACAATRSIHTRRKTCEFNILSSPSADTVIPATFSVSRTSWGTSSVCSATTTTSVSTAHACTRGGLLQRIGQMSVE
jgi:hypothetical protein